MDKNCFLDSDGENRAIIYNTIIDQAKYSILGDSVIWPKSRVETCSVKIFGTCEDSLFFIM